jgi:hypothetical protein
LKEKVIKGLVNKKSYSPLLIWLLNAFIIVASIIIVSCMEGSRPSEQKYPDVEIGDLSINTSTEMIAGTGGYDYSKHI